MRTKISLATSCWKFTDTTGNLSFVTLPHTWNAKDGQNGGNNYRRGTCTYATTFTVPEFDAATQQVWLQFDGVNSSADVWLNGQSICTHDGGYSTFRIQITDFLETDNQLIVKVDNSTNDHVYPQKADFTFYGGIYRDVTLLIVSRNHIALGHFGDTGVKISPCVKNGTAEVSVSTTIEGEGTVEVELLDASGEQVGKKVGENVTLRLENPHLWNGVKDPYLYTCVVRLLNKGKIEDEVQTKVGIRTFSVDSKKGFFLNGKSYPLHGVSRHQDRKGLGKIGRAHV